MQTLQKNLIDYLNFVQKIIKWIKKILAQIKPITIIIDIM